MSRRHPTCTCAREQSSDRWTPRTAAHTACWKPAKEAERKRQVGVHEASHVYVCEGAVIGPLDATYRGPYRVLVRERRKLLLEIGATRTWVPVDRLKQHVGKMSP